MNKIKYLIKKIKLFISNINTKHIILVDINDIPNEFTLEKWFYYYKKLGLLIVDSGNKNGECNTRILKYPLFGNNKVKVINLIEFNKLINNKEE